MRHRPACLIALAVVCVCAAMPAAQEPGTAARDATAGPHVPWMQIAPTPPMGWNSWNKFGCNVSESLIREDGRRAWCQPGMRDAGYNYIVIDDCWQVSPRRARHHHGRSAALSRWHEGGGRLRPLKGLKFGIYSDAGAKTCAGAAGQQRLRSRGRPAVRRLGRRLPQIRLVRQRGRRREGSRTAPCATRCAPRDGRSCSACASGAPAARGPGRAASAHLWRTTGDIQDCWDCVRDWGGLGWVRILDKQVGLEKFAGPGGWNDPDMLEVGNGGLTTPESRAHFSFWALLASPLMAGNDIRKHVAGDARHSDQQGRHRRQPGRAGAAGPQGA